MKLEITLVIDESTETPPTIKEMRDQLHQYLNYQNPHDSRRFIAEAKVKAKRERKQ